MTKRISKTLIALGLFVALVASLLPGKQVLASSTETLRPNASGYQTQITNQEPTSGYHWDKVDEASADEATTMVWMYNTAWRRDLYNIPDSSIPTGSTINFIKIYTRCRSSTPLCDAVKASLRAGSTTVDGSAATISTAWETNSQVWYTNPVDSQPWEKTDIDSLQIGVYMASCASAYIYCTQIYVEVDYTPISAPTVTTTTGATSITTTTARLNGNVTATGGEDPTVTVYWGDNDGGTTPGSWDNNSAPTSPGQPQGVAAFYKDATSLTQGTQYFYSAKATNSGGTGWGTTQSFYTLGPPTVTSSSATNVEETTATWNGNITSIGGVNCDYRGFAWGTTSRADPGDVAPSASGYDTYWYQSGSYGTGTYTYDVTTLTEGTTWYYRSYAHNTYGWDYSNTEQTVYTKPGDPTSLDATAVASDQIDLTWAKGTGAEKTMVRGKLGSYPTGVTDGYEVYFDTGTSDSDTGLTQGTTYFYVAYAWDESSGYSDGYSQDSATTPVGALHMELWFQPNEIIVNTGAAGTADSGSTITLVDDALTQANDYWNLARLIITETTDNLAPEGETAVVTDFTAADDTLHFAALTAGVGAGDEYTVDFGTLPDRTGTAQDGRITWGVNSGLDISVGGLKSITSYVSGPYEGAELPEVLPLPEGAPLYEEEEEVVDLPGYSGLFSPAAIGLGWSTNTLYAVIAIFVAIGIGAGVAIATGSHMLAALAVGGTLLVGTFTGVLGWWVVIVYGIFATGYLFAVRSV